MPLRPKWLLCGLAVGLEPVASQFQLGIYGPLTSVTSDFLTGAVLFDYSFRALTDSTLLARFGGNKIIDLPSPHADLAVNVQIGTSNSDPNVGIATNIDFFSGANGLTKIAGLVGGYHSAVSTPVATLATYYKVPQVSFASTAPGLSNKAVYPFFLRTIPPDSIQGAGMWAFIRHFQIPQVTYMYSQEAYGEGLYQVVQQKAALASMAYRVNGLGVEYMPSSYDKEVARGVLRTAFAGQPKVWFLAMGSDQSTELFAVLQAEGGLGGRQLVGSESVALDASLPLGYMYFLPQTQGAKYPEFVNWWTQLQASEVGDMTAYNLDKLKVAFGSADAKTSLPTDSDLSSATAGTIDFNTPLLFDAAWAFVYAVDKLLKDGTAMSDIKEDLLLQAVKDVNFEGVSGTVIFNQDGDRLAQYFIVNLKEVAGTRTTLNVAAYNAADDSIAVLTGQEILWVDGTSSTASVIPGSFTRCQAGWYTHPDTMLCTRCGESQVTNAAGDGCSGCPQGMVVAVDADGGRYCEYFSVEIGFYGPITSVSSDFLCMAVAFELDFRKNFDADLRARFGPPIVEVPNLQPELRIKLQIGTSNSNPDIGMATNLDMFLGQKGRRPIVGLIGGYHSAISMPVAALAAQYKVTQVSFGSTSPSLSNKDQYPYFLRTIPPDSIQGGGMWTFIESFQIPSVSLIYAKEPYGEGLFQTVAGLAGIAGKATAVQAAGVRYMPVSYDDEVAAAVIRSVLAMSSKVIFICMTKDQAQPLFVVGEREGFFSSGFHLVGSEALNYAVGDKADGGNFLGAGYMFFSPTSRGALWPAFEEFFKNLTAADVVGPAAVARHGLDLLKVGFDGLNFSAPEGSVPPPRDEDFLSPDLELEAPFVFDAGYSLVVAANALVQSRVFGSAISGEKLLAEVKKVDFEGISGRVSFNEFGDRLAEYQILNARPAAGSRRLLGERRLSAVEITTVAVYSAATSAITVSSTSQPYWMTGTYGSELPSVLTDCKAGFFQGDNRLCVRCPEGHFSAGGSVPRCEPCPAGTMANALGGATGCIDCEAGSHAPKESSSNCTLCAPGSFSADRKSSQCEKCSQGWFQSQEGETFCRRCGPNENTLVLAAESEDECKCQEGFFRLDANSPCTGCKEGMDCPFGSDLSNYRTWVAAGRDPKAEMQFPLLQPSYMSLAGDALSVYKCGLAKRCPGGPPGTCAPGSDLTARSCALCEEGKFFNGEACEECTFIETSSILFPVVPILIFPIIICILYKVSRDESHLWGTWRNGLAAFVFMIINHYQVTVLVNNANLQYSSSVASYLNFFKFAEDPSALFAPDCAGFQAFGARMVLSALGPIFVAVLIFLTAVLSKVVARIVKKEIGFDFNRTLNVYFSLMFTFFAGISAMALTMFQCSSNPNKVFTLTKDQSLICYESEWTSYLVISILSVILYIFGFGGVFTWAVTVAPKKFQDQAFRRRWKFLFIKFRPDVWWFALVICSKGVLMNVGYTFLKEGIAQIYWVMFIVGIYLGCIAYLFPWRHRKANALDFFVNMCLIFLCSMLAFYVHSGPAAGTQVETDIANAIIAVNIAPVFLASALLGHMLYEQWHPEAVQRRNVTVINLLPAMQLFSTAPQDEIAKFMNGVDEWGRFYILNALHVINTEFAGAGEKPRLSDGSLKSSSSIDLKSKSAPGKQQAGVVPDDIGVVLKL